MDIDVLIIGGGPAGSTAGAFLKKYNPNLNVLILEREKFPREHVGESQLPPLAGLLDELGCWDKVEAADFPIKIGATYRWGKSPELWDFEFLPSETFREDSRPGKFRGQRVQTAFQVDRGIYDKILLDHARSLGCEVREETAVTKIHSDGDRITGIETATGEKPLTARYYLDASGHAGILRRSLGVEIEAPTHLQNIAIWDYWQDAEWAVTIGKGGTRIFVYSLGYGWIWFIPISSKRTSVGLVVPAEYYKQSGLKPAELYAKALREEERVSELLSKATCEDGLRTTKDWSFLANRLAGENWFLVGESAGFADPILSAGLTLSQFGAREVAFTILELDKGKVDSQWLKDQYHELNSQRILSHIRFAEYWYTANAQLTDLKQYTSEIAAKAGLDLSPERAWAWLAQGGFISGDLGIGTGGFSLNEIRSMGAFLSEMPSVSLLENNNVFKLNLEGATQENRPRYLEGQVIPSPCYVRGSKVLPILGPFSLLISVLENFSKLPQIVQTIVEIARLKKGDVLFEKTVMPNVTQAMEAMITDGWIEASYDPSLPLMPITRGFEHSRKNRDPVKAK